MKDLRIASFLLLQLLLLSNRCSAESNKENENLLARMLLDQFASNKVGGVRKLFASRFAQEFGPGSDWSCSAENNQATDLESCILSEASVSKSGGCSWCPLGGSTGVCLHADQAKFINDLENQHLLHLKCYSHLESPIEEEATAFWDEVMACLPHSKDSCGGDHDDHVCTYCTVGDPAMGLCLSHSLWDNLAVAQSLEYFEADASTNDYIRLDQVFHCTEDIDDTGDDEGIWNNPCDGSLIDSDEAEEACFTKEGCAIAPNIFPGFLGSKSGVHCVGVAQERATSWAMGVLTDMGWNKEMDAFRIVA